MAPGKISSQQSGYKKISTTVPFKTSTDVTAFHKHDVQRVVVLRRMVRSVSHIDFEAGMCQGQYPVQLKEKRRDIEPPTCRPSAEYVFFWGQGAQDSRCARLIFVSGLGMPATRPKSLVQGTAADQIESLARKRQVLASRARISVLRVFRGETRGSEMDT